MTSIAVAPSHSPFILDAVVNRITGDISDAFMSGIYTAEETAKLTAKRINEEIQRNLKENPGLQKLYKKQLQKQKEIDSLRKAGKPVPLNLIDNPFYKRYYKFKHWTP